MSGTIGTVGYEGAMVEDVIRALRTAGVVTLVDVRAVPHSRKPGFAKRDLRRDVEAAGLRYLHLGALGNPAPGRRAAKAGRREEYLAILDAQLDTAAARDAFAAAADLMRDGPIALLCYERDPARCHRSVVADRLAALTHANVDHLRVAAAPETLPLFGASDT